ncbi:hypothetical protein EZS27_020686 [termite gut metagenome]|uniref:Uncharacterized protein n=1 Tax=termite gut metagenome TaxID=433724 RepID=A0A5J4RCH1_9ZZZZ
MPKLSAVFTTGEGENLFDCTEKIRQRLSEKFSHLSNLFIVDSTPVEICKMSREKRSSNLFNREYQT